MAALLCLGVFAGCAGTKDIKIGAMPADSNISFFQELAKGMEAAGKPWGHGRYQYTGRDIEKELSLTQTFISQGYSGLVLETVDSSAITGCLSRAQEADIRWWQSIRFRIKQTSQLLR